MNHRLCRVYLALLNIAKTLSKALRLKSTFKDLLSVVEFLVSLHLIKAFFSYKFLFLFPKSQSVAAFLQLPSSPSLLAAYRGVRDVWINKTPFWENRASLEDRARGTASQHMEPPEMFTRHILEGHQPQENTTGPTLAAPSFPEAKGRLQHFSVKLTLFPG